ncbi:MAG: replication factor C small subunit [Candidatus Thermoplasmatota archaeon]|nr:replication factor C small subunit [Candidatus Thermoplasmatota archaeon]
MALEEVWLEKFRPASLDDVLGQDHVVSRLKGYVKAGQFPHLLFAGPAGTGKTTCAIAAAKEVYGEDWQQNFQELNASDERGINTVRTKIKDFARTAPLGDASFKLIFLDEADNLTSDAQAALRRTMERYAGTCRFILSCNYSSRIIDPIQSRCTIFRFRPIAEEGVRAMVERIAKEETLEVTEDGMEAILYVASGDMRRAVNTLQMSAAISDKIDSDVIYETATAARPEEVEEMVAMALQGDFLDAREKLDDLLVHQGLSGEDVVRQVHRTLLDVAIEDKLKIRLIDRLGEAEYRLVMGANERVQLEAMLAHFGIVRDA